MKDKMQSKTYEQVLQRVTYEQVLASKIKIEEDYQRKLKPSKVKNIVGKFNPYRVNPPKVSKRDGVYWAFDGQHTIASLRVIHKREGEEDFLVGCMVYNGLTLQEEAELFATQNDGCSQPLLGEKFKSFYTANNPEIVEMTDAIKAHNIIFDFTQSKADNKIACYAAIQRVWNKCSRTDFDTVLNLIIESWGREELSFNQAIIEAVCDFHIKYKGEYKEKTAITKFSKVKPEKIIRDGKMMEDSGIRRYSYQLVKAYNYKNIKNILDKTKVFA